MLSQAERGLARPSFGSCSQLCFTMTLACSIGFASLAQAFPLQAQVLVGKRAPFPLQSSSRFPPPAREIVTGLSWTPFEDLPAAFGLSYGLTPSAQTSRFSLEARAFLPYTSQARAYLRVAALLPASSRLRTPLPEAEAEAGALPTIWSSLGGFQAALGWQKEILPILVLMLEIGRANEIIRDSTGNQEGLRSFCLMAGVELSLDGSLDEGS